MIILPTNTDDPTGQDRRERGAIDQFDKRFKRIGKDVLSLLDAVKVKKKTLFSPLATNAADDVVRYEFEVDELGLQAIGMEIDAIVDRWLEVRGEQPSEQWLVEGYVTPAYQQGTGMAFANLATQSKAYKATRESLTEILKTPEYRRRLGFMHARSFEAMTNLSNTTKESMRLILTDGMAQGLNPLEIARQIDEQTSMGITRARRIARTEITTAMRRARVEEAEQAAVDLGLSIRMMQLSALSATTRLSHAIRHGKLYTFEQVRVWMSTRPNMINCKCTFVEVVVDANGKPYAKGVLDRAQKMFDQSAFAGQ